MKVFLRVSSVALLVVITALAGCASKTTSNSNSSPADNATIPVLLPDLTEVTLKGGQSKSGRLTAFDNKHIVITPGGGSPVSILIDQIKDRKVTFNGQVIHVNNNGNKVRYFHYRILKELATDPWQGIPLSDFKLQDPDTAQVKITSLDKTKQKGIQQVAVKSEFRLQEMQLEPASGKMTLKVKALDKKTLKETELDK